MIQIPRKMEPIFSKENPGNGVLRKIVAYVFLTVLSDFINLTQVHNFTVSAQGILPSVDFRYLPFYENFASTNADNETFCTVIPTSQVVLVQNLQPKGPEFEST